MIVNNILEKKVVWENICLYMLSECKIRLEERSYCSYIFPVVIKEISLLKKSCYPLI
jgi:hypothetical protein